MLGKLLPFLLSSLLISTPGVLAEPRTFEGSVNNDADDSDRGVLGVRYAVGVDLGMKTHVIVMGVVKGGPAEAAGLRRGDRVVQIEGAQVKDLASKSIGRRMRGEPGTELKLTVRRGGEEMPVTIVRGGLTKLPDAAFRSRLMANALNEEREVHMKKLAKNLSVLLPDVYDAINDGDYKDAELGLQRAIQADSNLVDGQLLYALVLDRTGKSKTAQELFQNIAERKPRWPEAWQSLALCYEARGNYTEAVAALKTAIKLVTDKDTEEAIRARISELSGRTDKQ